MTKIYLAEQSYGNPGDNRRGGTPRLLWDRDSAFVILQFGEIGNDDCAAAGRTADDTLLPELA